MSEARIVIVGAGPAGVRAAEALVNHGLAPIVIDEAPAAGGQIYRRPPAGFARPARVLYGFEAAKAQRLHAAFEALRPRLDYRPDTLAWNVSEGSLWTQRSGTIERIPFDRLILCTGAMDRVIPLPGWTLPGAFTLGGAQVALKAQGCAVGRRTVFFGTGPLLYLVAHQIAAAGATVAAVLDTSRARDSWHALAGLVAVPTTALKGAWYQLDLVLRRTPWHRGIRPLAVMGRDRVEGVRFRDANGTEREIACDAVAFGYGLKPETQLAELAGAAFAYDGAGLWLPRVDPAGRLAPNVYAAGDGCGILGADAAELAGRRAGLAVAADLGRTVPPREIAGIERRRSAIRAFRAGLEVAFPTPTELAATLPDATILCRCEGATVGALRTVANHKDAGEINQAKALCRVGMGRCQGRVCGFAACQVLAAARGVSVEAVGRLRAQAPVKPLPLAARLP